MPDIFAIKGAIDGLKLAREMAKSAVEIRDGMMMRDKVIELTGIILSAQASAIDAQAEQLALLEEIDHLKKELMKFEDWEAQKRRYELQSLPPGVFVYALKADMAEGETAHYICQTCYQRGKRSILHQSEPNNGVHHLKCHECGTDLKVGHWNQPPINYGPRGGGGPNSWMGT